MPLATVLIEDSPTIRSNLIPALQDLAGAEIVGVAETASEAVAVLEALGDGWQLAVVDLFLREGSGVTVLRAFQGRLPRQRMVVLTNYPTTEIRRRCLDVGADAVFDKSTELESFFEWCLQDES
ncbi:MULTISPECIES: response regulator [unclassified Variovorax]|uniref:response regulator n=1 Tax=unclassified Variovorax TaxID=663243 RepID=UPI0008CB8086|nr:MULTISPECIES: response regulator [unclassified Variovorax]SEK16870.1 Response regulator receiver domain-containing protein [Variovorax sp. OK202]SFE62555.1 Response regulator receiver domain-containing protein [Variovorax sp. OK212]